MAVRDGKMSPALFDKAVEHLAEAFSVNWPAPPPCQDRLTTDIHGEIGIYTEI